MSKKVLKNVSIILLCSIVAKGLAYVWEAILAYYLGASDQADAIYMTTSIFGILYPILDLGIWKVFLPIYKKKLVEHKEKKAEQIANTAVTFFLILSVALVLFLIVCAKPIVAVVALGFDSEKKAITVEYLRLSAPTYLLMTSASVVGAMLQSREKFLGSQIREIGTHVSKIIFVFICYRFWGIYAAITAMIVGSIFRLIIQLPFINWKWRFRPNINFSDEDFKPMIKGLPSVAITAAIVHINGMVDKIVASGSVSGSVSCLNYGYKLMNVFSGMVSTAISTAVYPTMIKHITQNEEDQLKRLINNVICALMFCILPISFFCFLFSKELVTVAFQRGAFDASATLVTSRVFIGYCLGMLFLGIASVVTNIFYGYGDTKITMYISIVEIILNVIFDITFVKIWGVAGLAFATSISAIICLCLRFIYLRKYIRIGYKSIFLEGIKIIVVSLVSCSVPFFILKYLIHTNAYFSLLISVSICLFLYVIFSRIAHIETFDFVLSIMKKRVSK